MNEVCRFCLIKSKEVRFSLFGASKMLDKLRGCINIEISPNTSLPTNICKDCVQKVEDIDTFCSKVKSNEDLLRKYIENNTLQEFYNSTCMTYEYEHQKLKKNYIVSPPSNHCNLNITKSIFAEEKNEIKYNDMKMELNDNIKSEPITTTNDNHDISIKVTLNETNVTLNETLETSELILNDSNERCDSSDDNQALSTIKNKKTNKCLKRNEKNLKAYKNESNMFIEYTENNHPNMQSCLMCSEEYLSYKDLVTHYNNEHLDKNGNTEEMYTKMNVDGTITFKCNKCDKVCSRRKDITKHVNVHNTERPFVCKICGRTYKTVSEILRHGRVHSGIRYMCSYKCGYSTAYSGTLKAHELKHREGYKYKCEQCEKGFHVRTWYEQHQNIHNGLKPFVCTICGAAFPMDRYLTSHRISKHPQTLDVKRYVCMHCGQKCDSANSLDIHLQEHGIQNKQKGVLCDTCGKILCTTDQVKYHHRMHAGIKLFSCGICNKTFSKKFNLQLHERSHSGEKKHTCAQCGKRYTQKSTLTRHINNVHEPPATCATE